MTGFIAVHCGAGTHSSKNHAKYNRLSKKACRKGTEVLRNGGSALEAVKVAITILEDNPLTNCGYGSNLTIDGRVENDASIMDGKNLHYGACGAVSNVKNPIQLAYDICLKQSESLPLGLVPPFFLVGRGALKYAKAANLKTVKPKILISPKALTQYKKYKTLVHDSSSSNGLLDTVGAVCIDATGNVAAGCSSGGIILKKSGRVGQAGIYASGIWADSFSKDSENSVAVCTSGCGEYLIRTQLAKTVAEEIKNGAGPTLGLSECISEKFLHSRFLRDVTSKLCGALVLFRDHKTGDTSLLWAHTTESMSIGYMRCGDEKPKALISELPTGVPVGVQVSVSGVYDRNAKE